MTLPLGWPFVNLGSPVHGTGVPVQGKPGRRPPASRFRDLWKMTVDRPVGHCTEVRRRSMGGPRSVAGPGALGLPPAAAAHAAVVVVVTGGRRPRAARAAQETGRRACKASGGEGARREMRFASWASSSPLSDEPPRGRLLRCWVRRSGKNRSGPIASAAVDQHALVGSNCRH